MQLVKGKEQIALKCFYIGIAFEIIVMLFAQTPMVLPFASRFQHIAFVFFGLKIIGTYYTKREWLALLLMGTLGIISYLAIREEKAICIIMMVIASKEIPVKKIVHILFWSMLGTSVVVIFIALFGYGQPLVDVRDYGRGVIEARWGFGLGHANNMHGMVWYLVTLLILGYYEVLSRKHYIGLSILNILLFQATASRTGFLLVQVMIIMAWLTWAQIKWIENTWLYVVSYIGIIILITLTIMAGLYGTKFHPMMELVDRLLSGRLEFFRWYAGIDTWRWIQAQEIKGLIDNGIAKLFASNGYVIASVYLVITIMLVAYYQKHRSKYHFICLLVLMTNFCYSFMEATFTFNSYMLLNLFYVLLMNQWQYLIPGNEKYLEYYNE